MISTFKRNRHFRKVLVKKAFAHAQEQGGGDIAAAFRLRSVWCGIIFGEWQVRCLKGEFT